MCEDGAGVKLAICGDWTGVRFGHVRGWGMCEDVAGVRIGVCVYVIHE